MFGKMYIGELKKICRPKSMIALTVVLAVLLLLYAVLCNFIVQIDMAFDSLANSERIEIDFDEMAYDTGFSKEEIEDQIRTLENMKADVEDSIATEKDGYYYTSRLYDIKAELVAYRYIRDNKLYDQEVYFLGYNDYLCFDKSEGFTKSYLSLIATILTIYGLVVGAGLLSDEYKNGTIKLIMSRPISKSGLVSAKLAAALTVSIGFLSVFTLIAFGYSAIAFGTGSSEIYLVFNANKVLRSTTSAVLFAEYFVDVINICAYTILAYFVGTLLRKKTPAILITLFVYIGLLSSLLNLTPAGVACFSLNTNPLVYFSVGANVPAYGNFFLSVGVFVAYLIVFVAGLYVSFNKRDII